MSFDISRLKGEWIKSYCTRFMRDVLTLLYQEYRQAAQCSNDVIIH